MESRGGGDGGGVYARWRVRLVMVWNGDSIGLSDKRNS